MAAPRSHMDFEQNVAQKLACNDRTVRDRAVKKLRKYFEARSQSQKNPFTKDDLIKIWKGLHYCMWMSDKPIVQEDLSENISTLLHSFQTVDARFLFIETFFETEAREWFGIDRLRMDKFMMLIRRVLRQTFVMLKNSHWDKKQIDRLVDFLSKDLISQDGASPLGMKLHVRDVYYPELKKAGANEISPEQVLQFLEPFIQLFVKTTNPEHLTKFFMVIIKDSGIGLPDDILEERKSLPQLTIEYDKLADRLFELASAKKCNSKNRKAIYNIVSKLRSLSEGIYPHDELDDSEDEGLRKADINQAVDSLVRMESRCRKRKKKRGKHNDQDDDAMDSDDDDMFDDDDDPEWDNRFNEEEDAYNPEPKAKKKKKGKKNDNSGSQDKNTKETSGKGKNLASQSKKNLTSQSGKNSTPQSGKNLASQSAKNSPSDKSLSSKSSRNSTGRPETELAKDKFGDKSVETNIKSKKLRKAIQRKKSEEDSVLENSLMEQELESSKSFETERSGRKKRKSSSGFFKVDDLSPVSKKAKVDTSENVSEGEVNSAKKGLVNGGTHSAKKKRRSLGTGAKSVLDESLTPKVKKIIDESETPKSANDAKKGRKSETLKSIELFETLKSTEGKVATPQSAKKKKKTPQSSSPPFEFDFVTKIITGSPTKGDSPPSPKKGDSPPSPSKLTTPATASFGGIEAHLNQTPVAKVKTPKSGSAKSKSKGTPESASRRKKKGDTVSPMVSFDKVRTPPAACVKKAMAKVTPQSKQKEITSTSTPMDDISSSSKKKRVSFIMTRNKAQEFKESLNISPLPPFQPEKKPEQGILKSPAMVLRVKQKFSPKMSPLVAKSYTPNAIRMLEKKGKRTKRVSV